jgi:hypothetical protein
MIRRAALIAALVAAGLAPVLAQTQTRPHPQHPPGQPHERPAHPPMDPALHAALHARLVGNWSGTITGADAASTKLQVAIASGKQGQMTLKLATDRSLKPGAASEVALDTHGLHWTQALTGTSCKATATVEAAAAHHGTDMLKGKMTCGQQEMTFALQKN